MARNLPTFLTRSDVVSLCQNTSPEAYKKNELDSMFPHDDVIFLRKTFTLFFEDGRQASITFKEKSVIWNENGVCRTEAADYYEGPSMGIHNVHFLKTDVLPYTAVTLLIDLPRASFTLLTMALGNENSNRDVERTIAFGTLDKPGKSAHGYTEDLTGKAFDLKFAEDVKMHLLFENATCSEIVSHVPEKTPEWAAYYETFNPTKYVKLRMGVYLVSFYAPGATGAAFNLLLNTRWGRSAGNFFGIDDKDQLRFYLFSAEAKEAEFGFKGEYVI